MKWNDLLENWGLNSIKLNLKFAQLEFTPNPDDEIAAWEMYVELITRIATQELPDGYGDEKTALKSLYQIFDITRGILKQKGRKCDAFTKLSIVILNQVIRPFTAKWHKISLDNNFEDATLKAEFRQELKVLQSKLKNYTKLLADIAKVEDLTDIQ